MAYEKTTWARGDVVTSAKLNNIEKGIKDHDTMLIIMQKPGVEDDGKVWTCEVGSIPRVVFKDPVAKKVITVSKEEAAQLYALVEQLKTVADSATTKTAAMGVPFPAGADFLGIITGAMSGTGPIPIVQISGDSLMTHIYAAVYDASSTRASFGSTDMNATTLYEVRFFVNQTTIAIRVTSCPFSIVGA